MLGLKIAITGLITLISGCFLIAISENPFTKTICRWYNTLYGLFILGLIFGGLIAIIIGLLMTVWF